MRGKQRDKKYNALSDHSQIRYRSKKTGRYNVVSKLLYFSLPNVYNTVNIRDDSSIGRKC